MDANAKGFWLLPSKGHATDRLPAFMRAAIATGVSTQGIILVPRSDYDANVEAYGEVPLPEGWSLVPGPDVPTGPMTEWARERYCAECDWIGWLADDLHPETQGWDVKVLAKLTGMNVVSTADGVFAPRRMNGATAWSGDLVRAVGYLYPLGFKHFFIDDVWEHLGSMTGCWQVDMSIMVRHEHDLVTGKLDRMGAAKDSKYADDERAFAVWKREEKHLAGERILAMLEAKGVKLAKHDTRGVSLMIAVPSGDRRYDGRFMVSLIATIDHVKAFGGHAELVELPFCSDIVMARTGLFGAFRRSTHTHMILIDDDMGWNPADVLKMLTYKKDFVAVAGPRKTSPPSFAVSCNDDFGNPSPITMDPETELLTGNISVGMAFTLLSKACVERLAQHYADLEYTSASGTRETCVFLPMILNGRYLSEDFAACHRWRAIGGQVFIDATVSLDHVGQNVWSGSWINHLQAQIERQQREAA